MERDSCEWVHGQTGKSYTKNPESTLFYECDKLCVKHKLYLFIVVPKNMKFQSKYILATFILVLNT